MNNVSISSLLAAWASQGLFLPAGTDTRAIAGLTLEKIAHSQLEQRPFQIRQALASDLPQLLKLEDACWAPALRSSPELLLTRIKHFAAGQWVLEMDGCVQGAIYSQRITDVAALFSHTAGTVWQIHEEGAPVAQFLAVNVFPQMEHLGLGDQLLEFALQLNSARSDTHRIVAVSLCRDFSEQHEMPQTEYIHATDSAGRLIDPILRFHQAHGAQISGLVAGFRPDDAKNQGCGVLVEYDPNTRSETLAARSSETSGLSQSVESEEEALAAVRQCMTSVKPSDGTWSDDKALMDMGFESLQLLELRSVLSRRFNQNVPATFFFQYNTPQRIAEYLYSKSGSRDPEGAPAQSEPEKEPAGAVAIIGMACRWPGGVQTPQEFWEFLNNGSDAVTEVPPGRWDTDRFSPAGEEVRAGEIATRRGGFLQDIDCFDADFFNISPREASRLDPQQRLLLEVAWESLESAGINPQSLKETRTGVFVGTFSHDYELLQLKHNKPEDFDTYFATGNSASVAAGRLAYIFGSQGPTIAVDTACSSSLVAVHLACRSLASGDCDMAIAGAANLLLSPELSMVFSRAGMLSPDGRCGTFDAAANGYVRSEGCGVVVLKSLARARADGDPVLAVIRGSAINQDGHSNGLTAPNGLSQRKVMQAALDDAGVDAADVSYVEAHGTGTALGDPVEFDSIRAVYGNHRGPTNPLMLGSVKTNIGHTEAAAGLAGLMKVVLSHRHEEIPAHLHYSKPNPAIDLESAGAVIPTQPMPWASDSALAGVSSFGFSGTNAHMIIERAPQPRPWEDIPAGSGWNLCKLSGNDEAALRRLATRFADYIGAHENLRIEDVCWTANIGRADLPCRACAVASSMPELVRELRCIADGRSVASGPEELRNVAATYVQGKNVDWRVFHGHRRGNLVPLPFYPFDRQRHWLDIAKTGSKIGDVKYEVCWPEIMAGSKTSAMPSPHEMEKLLAGSQSNAPSCSGLLSQMENLAIDYVVEAFDALGLSFPVGDTVSLSQTFDALSIVEGQRQLGRRLVQMLVSDGILAESAPGYTVVRDHPIGNAESRWAQLLDAFPQAEAELRMFRTCGTQLHDVLRGNIEPLQLVFPDADVSAATALYEKSLTFAPMNTLLRAAVTQAIHSLPDHRKVRVLEIGAGTGGTTAHLLDALSSRLEEYVFTDIARLLVARARERFGHHAFMRFEALNIETDPSAAGFEEGRYDLILASNVLHATADLKQTLKHAKSLLAPGGLLVLVEGTRHQRWLDLIFGMLDGWWRFSDHELRPDHPLLEADRWTDILNETGFEDAVAVKPVSDEVLFDQALLVARVPARPVEPSAETSEHWLVFCDASGVGGGLSRLLRQRGHRVTDVYATGTQTDEGTDIVCMDARDTRAFRSLLDSLGEDDAGIDGCVYLWGLDSVAEMTASEQDLMDAVELGCASFLCLVQALIQREMSQPPKLLAVTRGAMPVGGIRASGLAQTPICGLAQVISQEHPEFRCRAIDLDIALSDSDAQRIADEITSKVGSTKVAYRDGARREPRLLRASRPDNYPGTVTVSPDAAYLVVGGLGGIGLEVVRWLVGLGARKIVVFGRSGVSPENTDAARALAEYEQAGARVTVIKGDVSLNADVSRLFETIHQLEMNLKGVFHAAGVFEDRLLGDHEWNLFHSVMAAKVVGSWNLHQATRKMDLDLFVLFSSATTLVCSKGLGNYVAANSFLDALAAHRRAQDLPAVSVALGPWNGVGMAAKLGGGREAQWKRDGLMPLASEQARASLSELLRKTEPQLAIMSMDWGRYADALGSVEEPVVGTLLKEIHQTEKARLDARSASVPQKAPESEASLQEVVLSEVRGVLGLDASREIDPTQGFFELGLDSLTSMELRNRLQKRLSLSLPTTLAFRFPSITVLSEYLGERLGQNSDKPAETTTGRAEAPRDIDALSDEQVEALLRERLSEIGC